MTVQPETHHVPPNTCSPNSRLPMLIYRNVLPTPIDEDSTTVFLTANGWRKDGTWGHIAYRHFHPNVHECYGIFCRRSTLLLGQGQGDRDGGIELEVQAGDVNIFPAGTAHVCLESSEDPAYRYIGVYPSNGRTWRSEMGRTPIDHDKFRKMIDEVAAVPLMDPVYGKDGWLGEVWE